MSSDKPSLVSYLLVYRKSGLPIYSKCFSGFCGIAMKEPSLLTGFLTAVQSFSTELVSSDSSNSGNLEAITMGETIMRFNTTTPSGHRIVVGLREDKPKVAEEIFKAVSHVLETKYSDQNWDLIRDAEFNHEFENALHEDALTPALLNVGGFHDNCPMGDNCLFRTLPTESSQKKSIWQLIKTKIQFMRDKLGLEGPKHTN
ncbi:MAG: hypothetical protein ACFFFG_06535 [Candidatus Thorarchaeota archaeon]